MSREASPAARGGGDPLPDPALPAPSLDDGQGFTAQDLIDQQARMEQQATEAIPFRFDECTHARGYLRQPVYACRTCGGGGVCAACSVACHGDHELVELFHRRHFRCDCGTPSLYREREEDSAHMRATGFPSDAKPCSLRARTAARGWDEPNDENTYTRNFRGQFCHCVRGEHYDAETEEEEMYQCLVCEDWLHKSCTALGHRHRALPEGFEALICDACMMRDGADVLRSYVSMPGWVAVSGMSGDAAGSLGKAVDALGKRQRCDAHDDAAGKRQRREVGACRRPTAPLAVVAQRSGTSRLDVFLCGPFRDVLCRCAECAEAWRAYPYVLDEEDSYDPPDDDDDTTSTSSTYDRALAAMQRLPRPQMLESLRAYVDLRDALYEHLRPYAQSHEPVSAEVVRSFFREHAARARK